ncbi:probable G-protein coupled receptor 139 [Hemitrygon akajei]|uniref:probable G-protein coupled receptor 139 n=1 Tax=Hemitrygon akajei TaxID=2704970 RepID=UPI003BF95303
MEKSPILQTEAIYYPILGAIGIPANLLAIVILSSGKCGLSRCIIKYLVSMAVADLMVLLVNVMVNELKEAYFPYSFLNYTPICSFVVLLMYISLDCSVWFTVAFTFDRFVAISCQSLRTKYCTPDIAMRVIAIIFLLSVLENIPIYFIFEPRGIINQVPWSCYVKSSFYTSPAWIVFLWLETALTPFAPYVVIIFLNSMTIKNIVVSNRVRSKLRGNNKDSCHSDKESDNRRKSIILLIAISFNFILLWMVNLACFICVQFTDTRLWDLDANDSFIIAETCGYMLRCLSTCTNTFIYMISQKKFREEMKTMANRLIFFACNLCKRSVLV